MTAERLAETLRRQNPPAFSPAYLASILPTVAEAPRLSRPAWVKSTDLNRKISTLSESERGAGVISLHQPKLFELQEQRALPIVTAPHPLAGHRLAEGMDLPFFRGTLEVAADLGVLHLHPLLKDQREPACCIGDLLLFLRDSRGPYCVNLDVKDTRDAFQHPHINMTPRTDLARAERKLIARRRLEETLYREVGIPTRQIAGDEIDIFVVANLKVALCWMRRSHNLEEDQESFVLDQLQTGLAEGLPALEVLRLVEIREAITFYAAKIVMYQAIWRRKFRVDLFKPFLLNVPMEPERKDVLEVYGDWFRRPVS